MIAENLADRITTDIDIMEELASDELVRQETAHGGAWSVS